MTTAVLTSTLTADAIAELAVGSLWAEADLTPKPGLVDQRGSGAHTDMDLAVLAASAEALRSAFAECASAAVQLPLGPELREAVGTIGRAGERTMLAATGGVNTHRGALWALGLLSAGAATTAGTADVIDFAARLASMPDPAGPATVLSHGADARVRYGVRGAEGEAQEGFPHVRRHALPALHAARRSGCDEASARLAALMALMAHLDDTCLLHRGGIAALRAVKAGARTVVAAGGCGEPEGRLRFAELDLLCRDRHLSPGGSGDLLSVTLFLDALTEGEARPCKR
ncbi:triphosphoribosyl-dephospho-CoA synthase [Mycobacterium sp. RTGN5]|uniref:triphosphoribosyl-dephospho-CoA synthase n=1 Tax=Mycobacterium sp. RTGN5 TaxID=3016522 RepID=UPI0029C996CB|nr:triphosphoribosyl-dephospho-CoA synthase [Mycobacterium sp. RTGN5]